LKLGFAASGGAGLSPRATAFTDMLPRFQLFFHDKHKQTRSVPRNA
jgi:hypothetical protein